MPSFSLSLPLPLSPFIHLFIYPHLVAAFAHFLSFSSISPFRFRTHRCFFFSFTSSAAVLCDLHLHFDGSRLCSGIPSIWNDPIQLSSESKISLHRREKNSIKWSEISLGAKLSGGHLVVVAESFAKFDRNMRQYYIIVLWMRNILSKNSIDNWYSLSHLYIRFVESFFLIHQFILLKFETHFFLLIGVDNLVQSVMLSKLTPCPVAGCSAGQEQLCIDWLPLSNYHHPPGTRLSAAKQQL